MSIISLKQFSAGFLAFFFFLLIHSCKKSKGPVASGGGGFVVETLTTTAGDISPVETAFPKIKGPTAMAIYKDTLYVCNTLANNIIKVSPLGEISLYAGTGKKGNRPARTERSLSVTLAAFDSPQGIACDLAGNVYVSDYGNRCIRKIDRKGIVSTYAGIPGISSVFYAPGPRLSTNLYSPSGLTIDNSLAEPVLYVGIKALLGTGINADIPFGRILRIKADETVPVEAFANINPTSTVAGAPGVQIDGLVLDEASRKLYLSNKNGNQIQVSSTVDVATGTARPLAGTSAGGYVNGFAEARFLAPAGLALDRTGKLLVADSRNNAVRAIQINPGANFQSVSTFAGNPQFDAGSLVDSADPLAARFFDTRGVVADSKGSVYVSDYLNDAIRKVDSRGVTTFAATPLPEPTGTIQTGTSFSWSGPAGITSDPAGNLLVVDNVANAVRSVGPEGTVKTVAGPLLGSESGLTNSPNGPGYLSRFNRPADVATDGKGNVYVSDAGNNCIRRISPSGKTEYLAGNVGLPAGYQDGVGTRALFSSPQGLAINDQGDLIVADAGNYRVRKVVLSGVDSLKVTTIAGSTPGFLNASDPLSARFRELRGVCTDRGGNIYVCDASNQAIRIITSAGQVASFAGSGITGNVDGLKKQAQFNSPVGICFDGIGTFYVTDAINHSVREIRSDGAVRTIAVDDGFSFFSGITYAAGRKLVICDHDSNSLKVIKLP